MNKPVCIEKFISENDCNHLISTYSNKTKRSATISGVHNSRTSSTYFLSDSDMIVKSIKQKASEYLKVPIENIENIQFLKYEKGEEYKYHNDYFAGENVPNQRVHTILVYLNTLKSEDGGETSFFYHKLKISPKQGMAVWFRNMTDDGQLVFESLHSGEPIKTDVVKYALNIWTRQSKVY
jgi:prolyl 4-hydroxylase